MLGSHYQDIFAFIVLILVLTCGRRACSANVWPTVPDGAMTMKHKLDRLPAIAALLLLVLPLIAQYFGNVWVRIIDFALLYVLLALGLNIVVGYAGLLDLGYVAFYAVGRLHVRRCWPRRT